MNPRAKLNQQKPSAPLQTSLSDVVFAVVSFYVYSRLEYNHFAQIYFATCGIAGSIGALRFLLDSFNATPAALSDVHQLFAYLAACSHIFLPLAFLYKQALSVSLSATWSAVVLTLNVYFLPVTAALFATFTAVYGAATPLRRALFVGVPAVSLLVTLFATGFDSDIVIAAIGVLAFGVGPDFIGTKRMGPVTLNPPIMLHYGLAAMQLYWLRYCF